MRNSWILLLSLPLLYWLGNQPDPTLTVIGQLGESSEQALRYEEIAFHREAGLTKISARDPEALLRSLSRADQGFATAKLVVLNNLQNQHTTKTMNGEPYRRRFPQFRPDGTYRGFVEDPGDFNWVYDPANPDAVQEGPKDGYVAKPAINPIQEQATLQEIASQRSVVQELIRQIAPNAVFSPVDPYTPWKPAQDLPIELHYGEMMPLSMAPLEPGRDFSLVWGKKQATPISSGPASVACALNWVSGESKYSEQTISGRYGFALLNALKTESVALDIDWRDAGNLGEAVWPEVEETLRLHRPVLLAFAGTAPSEKQGNIVVLVESEGDTLRYFDPATGQLAETTRQKLLEAPSHPDGNFVFLPSRLSQF